MGSAGAGGGACCEPLTSPLPLPLPSGTPPPSPSRIATPSFTPPSTPPSVPSTSGLSDVAGVTSGGGAIGEGVPLAAGGSGAFVLAERASLVRGALPLAVEE